MGKYTIGIDFGTLSARCVLVNVADGKETAVSVCGYRHGVMDEKLPSGKALPPGGFALQEPQDYVEALQTTIREVIEKGRIRPEEICAAGVDFTSCTMLPVKEDGTPLCGTERYRDEPNAYVKLWKHHSAQKYADRINEVAKQRGEDFLKRYGGKISSEWMFPKIMETFCDAPELYGETGSFMEAADWIVMLLTGRMTRNTSSLGFKAIWNPRDGYPPEDFFKELMPGMEHVVSEKLKGEIITIGSCAGRVTREAAALTGLKEGTIVAAGHLDAAGASVGAGVITPGRMLIMMGTSSCHELLAEQELYVPGETGLIALDWWNGNRSILVDGDLTGVLVGMTLKTRPEDIYRALVEATAYGTRKIIENYTACGIAIDEVIISGGIARKNPFIMQIYADVLGKPIRIAGSRQNAALSSAIWAAYAAGEANGGYSSLEEAVGHMAAPIVRTYEPDETAKPVYDILYQEYGRLHDYFGRGANPVMKTLKTLSVEQKKGYCSHHAKSGMV